MLSSWKQKAQRLAEQVSEAIAPSARSDRERLAQAWLRVLRFFEAVPRGAADGAGDDPLARPGALGRSPIPDCLAEMLAVIQREGCVEGETGPCLGGCEGLLACLLACLLA
jgi:hypothetical protein